MNNILAAAALALPLLHTAAATAGSHEYKNTPEYAQMKKDTRDSLKKCLDNENMTTKHCIKNYKHERKAKKKELKKMK